MWMAPKLRHRLQIRKPVQTPKPSGILAQSYVTMMTVWAEEKAASEYIKALRGAQTQGGYSHIFTIRTSAIDLLGKEFTEGFSTGFKDMKDVSQIKTEWFLFKECGSTTKGVLYRVVGSQRDDDHREYTRIYAEEQYEVGTGHPK